MRYALIVVAILTLAMAMPAIAADPAPATQPIAAADMAEIRLLVAQRQAIELQIENIALRAQLRDGLKDWRLDLQRGVWVAPPKPPEPKPPEAKPSP